MLQSTSVLVANKGGHKEIVEDGVDGLIYESNCMQSFISKVISLIQDDSLRNELANRALEKSSSKYSRQSQFKAIDKIYKLTQ